MVQVGLKQTKKCMCKFCLIDIDIINSFLINILIFNYIKYISNITIKIYYNNKNNNKNE